LNARCRSPRYADRPGGAHSGAQCANGV
jgi:hypothetical protein